MSPQATDLSAFAECHEHAITFPMGGRCPECAVLQAQHERDCAVEKLAELRKYSIAACSEMGCFCGDEEGEEKCSMCVLGEVIRAFDEPAVDVSPTTTEGKS